MTRAKSRSAQLVRGLACGLLLLAPPALPADGAAGLSGAPPDGCLPGDRGYLQARLRGALQAQLDWRGASLSCQGGLRADQHGIRVSLSGPLPSSGQRLRIIIGVDVPPGRAATGPTSANVTLIVEGDERIYATRGAGHCEVEALTQEALPVDTTAPARNPRLRHFRVAARGFCIDPVPALSAGASGAADRIYFDRFDFAAMASFDPESIDASSAAH